MSLMSRTPGKRRSPADSQRQAIVALTSDIVPLLQHDIDEVISKAHCKNLISEGMYRQSLSQTPDSISQKTRKFLDAITSRIVFDPQTYHIFLGILRSFRAFETIADKIEECNSNPSSPCKKPRRILHELNATDKENVPFTAALRSNDTFSETKGVFFKNLETQHQKPLEDLKKCLDDRVVQLKASHERELELKKEVEELKVDHKRELQLKEEEIARLREALCHDEFEKKELQKTLDETEEILNETLSNVKKSRTKSKVSPDKRQRRLSSVDGVLSMDKQHSPPGDPPYQTTPSPYIAYM